MVRSLQRGTQIISDIVQLELNISNLAIQSFQ